MSLARTSAAAPGPEGDCQEQFEADALGFLERCAAEYGDVAQFNLGAQLWVLISKPELVHEVLRKGSPELAAGPGIEMLEDLFGHSIVTDFTDDWGPRRKLIQGYISYRRSRTFAPVMVDEVERHVSAWSADQPLDLGARMNSLAFALLDRTMFSGELKELAAPFEAVVEAEERYDDRLSADREAHREALSPHLDALDSLVYETVGRVDRSEPRADLLGALLTATNEDGRPWSEKTVRDEIVTVVVAGHKTTATTMTWCLSLLAHHPDWQERLASELDAALARGTSMTEVLTEVPLLSRVIDETLRMYATLWTIDRRAADDLEVGGFRIPAGAALAFSPWVVQRDKRYFRRPELFDPDRFLPDSKPGVPKNAYFPFGAGPRICPGRYIARLEAAIAVAKIIHRFVLQPLEPFPGAWPTFELRPRGEVLVRLSSRRTA